MNPLWKARQNMTTRRVRFHFPFQRKIDGPSRGYNVTSSQIENRALSFQGSKATRTQPVVAPCAGINNEFLPKRYSPRLRISLYVHIRTRMHIEESARIFAHLYTRTLREFRKIHLPTYARPTARMD